MSQQGEEVAVGTELRMPSPWLQPPLEIWLFSGTCLRCRSLFAFLVNVLQTLPGAATVTHYPGPVYTDPGSHLTLGGWEPKDRPKGDSSLTALFTFEISTSLFGMPLMMQKN